MTPADFYFLLTPAAQAALQATAVTPITPHNHLQTAVHLRQQFTAAQAQAILETVLLRQEAATKFSHAQQMYFTRQAMEQASSEPVAQYRAQRFARLDTPLLADLGCSIGGDALALAAHSTVIGVELEPVRLLMARENVRVVQGNGRFWPILADLHHLPPLAVNAAFFDPARRDAHGKRIYSVHAYHPPLSLIDGWRVRVPHTAVKVSPGVDYAELPADAEAEFISVQGGVKECVLWYGGLHSGIARRATLLPGGHTLTTNELPTTDIPISEPQSYLYEPDGAVIRAHLVTAVAAQLNAAQLDSQIAYLTGSQPHAAPFATSYTVEDWFPFQLKRLKQYLTQRQIDQVIIKRRGVPIEPDLLHKQLKLTYQGGQLCYLFLTRVGGETAVLIGQKVTE